jgi:hypothetical protein
VSAVAVAAIRRRESGPHANPHAFKLRTSAAILAGSVLFDSAMAHFQGGWHDRRMYGAPTAALVSLAASARGGRGAVAGHLAALGTGVAGLFFHIRNVFHRPGGAGWNNLFYSSPIGAPGALAVAGFIGLAAERLRLRGSERREARALAGLAGAALWGEAAEVWLLHFRGAFHNPFMYLPVTIPPLAGAALLRQSVAPCPSRGWTRSLLRATSALGVIGTGFHIYGVGRNMGGWRNWRQNVLAGPPVPAPISFTGLALAGQAALAVLDETGKRGAEL